MMWVFLALQYILFYNGPALGQWLEIYTTAAVGTPQWTLAFRVVSGSMTMVLDLYGQNTSYGNAQDTTDHYMADIIPHWNLYQITKAKVVIVSRNKEKAFFLFNATSSNSISWFSIDRLLDTSYTDLTPATASNLFSIPGHKNRHFFINKSYRGCRNDIGWVVVIDAHQVRYCGWESPPESYNYPEMSTLVLFSQKSTATRWREYNFTAEIPQDPVCQCCTVLNKTKITDEELDIIMDDIKKELTIDKSTLTKNILKKISVKDYRPSSIAIGVSGAVLFSVPFILLILIDFVTLKHYLDRKKITVKGKV